MSEVLSPTPPVLCLSTGDAGRAPDRSTRTPERTIASVSAAVSSAVMPRRTIAMSSADGLVVGQAAVGHAGDEAIDVGAIERAAIPFCCE